MNPLAPGPMPGEPVFEWHTQVVSCGNRFTDAEAEEAAERRRKEKERQVLWAQRHREAEQRVASLERERDEELRQLPVLNRPNPVKNGPVGQGCGIGCVLWVALLAVSLVVLGVNGQLDSEDPRILGADNPLVFLPAMWIIGWIIALIQWPVVRWKRRRAEAAADRRDSERAQVHADFEGRIAAARRAARP